MSTISVDPAVGSWLKDANVNKAALSKKQKADRRRIRVKYDMAPELKEEIETEAERIGTSASQFAAFLLAFALKEYRAGNQELHAAVMERKVQSGTMRFEWNLEAPENWH